MDFHWHAELASTNDEAKELGRNDAPHGTLVGADFQSSGRGRSGKSWACAPGEGLMCSVVLRPQWEKRYWGWIALCAGLVIAELLERDQLSPKIKYPNDILVNGKKIAGILTEASDAYVVVGVGLNLNMSSLPSVDSVIQPTSYFLETNRRQDARAFAEKFQRSLVGLLDSASPLILRREVERRLVWAGQRVSLRNRNERQVGVISGLGDYGQLLLEQAENEIEVFDAHEIRPVE